MARPTSFFDPAISDDGRHVIFEAGKAGSAASSSGLLLSYDMQTQTTV